MKQIIPFSKYFIPTAIISFILMMFGAVGYFKMGFNLGVDFQAGLIQEVRFAPTAFGLTWNGQGNATVSFNRSNLFVVVSGVGFEDKNYAFPFGEYSDLAFLAQSLESRIDGIHVSLNVSAEASSAINSSWLIFNAQANPHLGSVPFVVHYLDPQSPEITIGTVREALASFGKSVSIQNLGQPKDRHFMIRLEDKGEGKKEKINDKREEKKENKESVEGLNIESGAGSETGITLSDVENETVQKEGVPIDRITSVLEDYFGEGEVVVIRSDFVGSRFSKNLTNQVGLLIGLTLLVMLIYSAFRFKIPYAVALVVGIAHDALVIVGLVVWSKMEFNTTTIAAILTIIGYSTNNTIVVFDRIRENLRIYPDGKYTDILNLSLTATLNRTFITTFTTMLAVLSLMIFTTGAMRDFAICLQVGMISGIYTTLFIASGIVNFWENTKVKRAKKKQLEGKALAVK